MRGGEANELRQSLSDLVRNVGPDNGTIVRRVTRTAALRADDLLGRLERGEADGMGVNVTAPTGGGEGGTDPADRFMWGWSAWGDGDLWGE